MPIILKPTWWKQGCVEEEEEEEEVEEGKHIKGGGGCERRKKEMDNGRKMRKVEVHEGGTGGDRRGGEDRQEATKVELEDQDVEQGGGTSP